VGMIKRGIHIVSLLVFVLLFVLFSQVVVAGYCGNPAESAYTCIEADQEDCCPATASYYGEDDVPATQEDCENNYYSEDEYVYDLCIVGCCYYDSETNCDASEAAVTCTYNEGTFDPNGCEGSIVVDYCAEGCCVYDEGSGLTSEVASSGYCEALSDNGVKASFADGVTDDASCSTLAAEYVAGTYECFDGMDNDNDGATDYPADGGCTDYADSSEEDAVGVCGDGQDNDGDGLVDTDDLGCCESEDTAHEQLCEVSDCSADGTAEIASVCNCYGEDQSEGTYCAAGNFCVEGVCQSEPAEAECSPGERQYCGTETVSDTTCLKYQECEDDFTWSTCDLDNESCGQEPELCTDAQDNDADGLVDCQDIDCYETYCGSSTSACADYGFDPDASGNYVCCATTDVKDCDSNGVYETCGSCDCLTTPITPEIDGVAFELGSAQLTVQWTLACAVEFSLLRCAGEECATSLDSFGTSAEVEAAFGDIVATNIAGAWEYTDTNIDANQRYCYVVKGEYADHGEEDTYSDPYCVDDSGDYWCQQLSTSEFCLDADLEMDGRLTYRYGCTEDNQLGLVEQCSSSGSDYVCIGPYDDGTTSCEYQSDCESCGDPLGLYAILDTSTLMSTNDDDYGNLCYELPMCYFDYTKTTVNNFHECAEITSCYDYESKSACEGQNNDAGFTNKCLQRTCAWEYLGGENDNNVAHGICKETSPDYAQCSACNDAEHNGVFDACTAERCQEFAVDDATCYVSGLTNLCTDIGDYTCTAYTDSTSCTGGISTIVLDDQTNEITTASEDILELGVCYWDGDSCYKDANGDEEQDDQQPDMTTPSTTILSDTKMASISISLLATDYDTDGNAGSGVKAVYYCLDSGKGCILDRSSPTTDDYEEVALDENGLGTIKEGDGSGDYTLYYYAEDYAENIEVMNTWDFEVDKSGPEIAIAYYVGADTSDPYDESSLTLEVTLNEEAHCTDSFDAGDGEINGQYNNHFVVKFDDLTDGWYVYSVDCTDAIGNSASAFIFAQIDADTAIFDSSPSEYSDESSVTLSVKTFDQATCGFSYNVEESSFADMDYGFTSTSSGSYYVHSESWELEDGNGLYSFDVKCQLSDGTEADDEIQFIYDSTAPSTDVVDSFGDAFDFAAYYEGQDVAVYLACTDEPDYGFGCGSTFYCTGTGQCTPDSAYDETDSIDYENSNADSFYVCYYSVEDTYAGMGGLTEDTQCTEFTIDYYEPSLDVSSPQDGDVVYVPYVTVTGTVDDPDATSVTAINTVEIVLITTEGEEIVYGNIDASDGTFSYTVQGLTLADDNSTSDYNTLYITAKDRSGLTAKTDLRVLYTNDIEGEILWIEEPRNGVTDKVSFDLVIGTFLEAEICGYSKTTGINFANYIGLEQVATDTAGEYLYGASYSLEKAKDGIPEYVYVTCELVNGIQYSQTFTLEYDSTAPKILDLSIENSDGKQPPSVVEYPLDPVIIVETDDRTLCKYSLDASDGFSTGMTKFTDYDTSDYSTENSMTLMGLSDQTSYTFYIACQNGAYTVSDTSNLAFTIDSTAASGIYLIEPEVTSSRTFSLSVGTTRTASSCTYGTSEGVIDLPLTDVGDQKQWGSDGVTVLEDGVYIYYASCWFVDGETTDYFDVIVDTSGPTIDWVEDGNISFSSSQLSAAWQATDDLTDIVGYKYSIGTRAGYLDIVNWTDTTENEALVDELNLTNQSTYYWNVVAYNELDLASNVDSSDGVFIDASGNGATWELKEEQVGDISYNACSNDVLDVGETDVDCGGSCDACADGMACVISDDCISLNCDVGICEEATCTDYIQNQGESDVDCGGNYCDACEEGFSCVYHRDCASSYCEGRSCAVASCTDNVKNGDEQGIDCGGSCSACEEVIYQQQEGVHATEEDEGGLGWFWWTLIFLLLVGLGVGGYYGYMYYMGGKGNPIQGLPALPGVLKKMPSQVMKKGKGVSRAKQIELARSRARQQKQAQRKKLFTAFDKKKPTDKLAVRKNPAVKSVPKKVVRPRTSMGKGKATDKLGEKVVIKKHAKKKGGDTFTKLDRLIKAKKKK
jgi:hypothetical protein